MYFAAHLNSLRGKSCSFFAVSRLTNCIPPLAEGRRDGGKRRLAFVFSSLAPAQLLPRNTRERRAASPTRQRTWMFS